uniref:Transposase n=1 Tax=Knipowitschia caucasica TaxID=637954 RepID=A0AAV2LCJ2_KNICA
MVVRKTTKPTLYREWRQGEGWTAAGRQRQADEVLFPVWKRQGARSNAWPRAAAATGRRAAASSQERTRGEPRWRHSDHGAQSQNMMWKRSRDHAGRTMCEA